MKRFNNTLKTSSRSINRVLLGLLSAAALCFGACDDGDSGSAQPSHATAESAAVVEQPTETPQFVIHDVREANEDVSVENVTAGIHVMERTTVRKNKINNNESSAKSIKPQLRRVTPSSKKPITKGVKKRSKVSKSETLRVVDSTLTYEVKGRMPQGRETRFDSEVGRVWAWVKVRNQGDASDIEMVWKHEGEVMARVPLEVGHGWGWRTWSNKRIAEHQTGAWTVDVVNGDGELIDSLDFLVTGGGDDLI